MNAHVSVFMRYVGDLMKTGGRPILGTDPKLRKRFKIESEWLKERGWTLCRASPCQDSNTERYNITLSTLTGHLLMFCCHTAPIKGVGSGCWVGWVLTANCNKLLHDSMEPSRDYLLLMVVLQRRNAPLFPNCTSNRSRCESTQKIIFLLSWRKWKPSC